MRRGSPFGGSWIVGTAPSGTRSERVETVRWRPGRLGSGEEEVRMPVEEVGTGVG